MFRCSCLLVPSVLFVDAFHVYLGGGAPARVQTQTKPLTFTFPIGSLFPPGFLFGVFKFFNFEATRFSCVFAPPPNLRIGTSRAPFLRVFFVWCCLSFFCFLFSPSKTPYFSKLFIVAHTPGSQTRRSPARSVPPEHKQKKKTSIDTTPFAKHAPPATTQTQEPANEQTNESNKNFGNTAPPPASNHRKPPPARTNEQTGKTKKLKNAKLKLQVPSPPRWTWPRW